MLLDKGFPLFFFCIILHGLTSATTRHRPLFCQVPPAIATMSQTHLPNDQHFFYQSKRACATYRRFNKISNSSYHLLCPLLSPTVDREPISQQSVFYRHSAEARSKYGKTFSHFAKFKAALLTQYRFKIENVQITSRT